MKGVTPMYEILIALGALAGIGLFVLEIYREYKRKDDVRKKKKD